MFVEDQSLLRLTIFTVMIIGKMHERQLEIGFIVYFVQLKFLFFIEKNEKKSIHKLAKKENQNETLPPRHPALAIIVINFLFGYCANIIQDRILFSSHLSLLRTVVTVKKPISNDTYSIDRPCKFLQIHRA